MNKHFFNFKTNINLNEILKVLDISLDEVLSANNFCCNLDKIYINDFVPFKDLKENSLSFLNNTNYDFGSISSGLCILEKKNIKFLDQKIIKIPFKSPKLGFSKILEYYVSRNSFDSHRIHPTAIIDETAKIGKNVNIGPYSLVGKRSVINDNTYVSERVSISHDCVIGKNCIIEPGVIIQYSIFGDNVKVYSNSVLGQPGFGFVPNDYNTTLIPHVGSLFIGEGTCIGSNCTIDRGFIEDTIIGKSVMIDNQVHIGHNCIIEDLCIIAGQVGLSGSVYLEKNVRMGGDVSIKDNVTIGENSIIAGASKVFNSFPKNSVIGGSPAQNLNDWKKIIASQRLNLKKQRFKTDDN
jgi:UDP-3-O-[3-hydroxymyristoyl] glucosamine N-acyltransferase